MTETEELKQRIERLEFQLKDAPRLIAEGIKLGIATIANKVCDDRLRKFTSEVTDLIRKELDKGEDWKS